MQQEVPLPTTECLQQLLNNFLTQNMTFSQVTAIHANEETFLARFFPTYPVCQKKQVSPFLHCPQTFAWAGNYFHVVILLWYDRELHWPTLTLQRNLQRHSRVYFESRCFYSSVQEQIQSIDVVSGCESTVQMDLLSEKSYESAGCLL